MQALAASRATRVPPVKRVSQVGGCSFHHRNPVLVLRLEGVIRLQVMGGDAIVCQSPAGASGITGDTGATGQTGVTGGRMLLSSQEPSASLAP